MRRHIEKCYVFLLIFLVNVPLTLIAGDASKVTNGPFTQIDHSALGGGEAIGHARQTTKIPRVGVLLNRPKRNLRAFKKGLRDLGWVEGENIAIEVRAAYKDVDLFRSLASELVRLKVDVIVAATTPGIRAAQRATRKIPIVMALSGDPVGKGFIDSLARPGRNITGNTTIQPQLAPKRVELLKKTVPGLTRVAALRVKARRANWLLETDIAARKLGFKFRSFQARYPEDIESAFWAMTRWHAEGLVIQGHAMLSAHGRQIADLAIEGQIATISPSASIVCDGGLMSFDPHRRKLWRRAATYVDKILRGAKPADLPVKPPTVFRLNVNLETAKALGLTIPPEILQRAHKVIQNTASCRSRQGKKSKKKKWR